MRLTRRITLAATALAAATALSLPAGPLHPATASAAGCTPTWKAVDTSAIASNFMGSSASVSALSSRDALITANGKSPFGPQPVARWDGQALKPATPPPTAPFSFAGMSLGLTSFASDTEGWGLANYVGGVHVNQQVTEHWHNGHWTMTPLAVPTDAGSTVILQSDVATLSATDAWTTGGLYIGGPGVFIGGTRNALGAMIQHWDGSQWSIVPNPTSDQKESFLSSITARSATDIWAVGQQRDSSGQLMPLVEHFDGTSWTVTPTPTPASSPRHLLSMSATSPTDAWAVGDQVPPEGSEPLIEHFDGTSWSVVANPPNTSGEAFRSVFASGPDDVWALMSNLQDRGSTNLALHFDGTSWTKATLPGPSEFQVRTTYHTLGGTAPNDVWAVGATSDFQPLLAHLSCGGV